MIIVVVTTAGCKEPTIIEHLPARLFDECTINCMKNPAADTIYIGY